MVDRAGQGQIEDRHSGYAAKIREGNLHCSVGGLEEFRSYLDNDAICFTDRRELGRDVNSGRCILTVKVDKDGYFSKFKARWFCRGFQDNIAWDNKRTVRPRPFGRSGCGQSLLGPFHLDLKTAFLQGEHYNLSSRMVAVQLPPDIGLPPWMVGLCLRPVYGLNDAPRRWWKRLDKFLRSVGLGPTRADRCTYDTYVAYDGTQEREPEPEPPGYLKEIVLHAMSCYTYDEASRTASDGAEERSYMSCPDIAQ